MKCHNAGYKTNLTNIQGIQGLLKLIWNFDLVLLILGSHSCHTQTLTWVSRELTSTIRIIKILTSRPCRPHRRCWRRWRRPKGPETCWQSCTWPCARRRPVGWRQQPSRSTSSAARSYSSTAFPATWARCCCWGRAEKATKTWSRLESLRWTWASRRRWRCTWERFKSVTDKS